MNGQSPLSCAVGRRLSTSYSEAGPPCFVARTSRRTRSKTPGGSTDTMVSRDETINAVSGTRATQVYIPTLVFGMTLRWAMFVCS